MIYPLRIAEIKQTIRERALVHRNPRPSCKVAARFNYQRDVCCPRNIKSKLVLSHSETSVCGLHLRIPQYSRTSGIGRPPSTGSGEVIDYCIGRVEKR